MTTQRIAVLLLLLVYLSSVLFGDEYGRDVYKEIGGEFHVLFRVQDEDEIVSFVEKAYVDSRYVEIDIYIDGERLEGVYYTLRHKASSSSGSAYQGLYGMPEVYAAGEVISGHGSTSIDPMLQIVASDLAFNSAVHALLDSETTSDQVSQVLSIDPMILKDAITAISEYQDYSARIGEQ